MPPMYTPLNKDKDEIRLLTIYPPSVTGQITCTLKNYPIGRYGSYGTGLYDWNLNVHHFEGMHELITEGKDVDTMDIPWVPMYEALSYTWAPSQPTHEIIINGQGVEVGHNLYCALRQLGPKDGVRTLWIDALCINQVDLAERSDQVLRMRTIYQRAKGVIIWLGDADLDSDVAFDTLERMCGTDQQRHNADGGPYLYPEYDPPENWSSDPEVDAEYKSKMYGHLWTYMDELGLANWSEIGQFGQDALRSLLKRDYWARIWCVQEVATAMDLVMICGSRKINLDFLHRRWFSPPRREDLTTFFALLRNSNLGIMTDARWKLRHHERAIGFHPDVSFLDIIQNYRDFKASDPRDKIYALLGLPSSEDKMPIDVDYNKSVVEIYTSTARAILDWTRDLSLLTLTPAEDDSHLGLPSWVPDWTLSSPQVESDAKFYASKDYPVSGQDFPSLNMLSTIELRIRQMERPRTQYNDSFTLSDSDLPIRRLDRTRATFNQVLGADDFNDRLSGAFRYRNSLVTRSQKSSGPHISTSPSSLHIEIVPVMNIDWVGRRITAADFETDTWKEIVRTWYAELCEFVPRPHPRDLINDFHTSLFRNSFQIPQNRQEDAITRHFSEHHRTIFREEFLVLLGKLSIEQQTHPDLHDAFPGGHSYEFLLKQKLRGWTAARVDVNGGIAMVPSRCQKGDTVVVAFGADVPLIMRPIDIRRWKLVGPAFCHGLMQGSVVEQLEEPGIERARYVYQCELV